MKRLLSILIGIFLFQIINCQVDTFKTNVILPYTGTSVILPDFSQDSLKVDTIRVNNNTRIVIVDTVQFDAAIANSTTISSSTTQVLYDSAGYLRGNAGLIYNPLSQGGSLRIGSTCSTSPLHQFVIGSARSTGNYAFNFVNTDLNRNRTTIAKATDTSSFSYYTTSSTGKGVLKYVDQTGTVRFYIDSAGMVQVGGTALSSYAFGVNGNSYFSGAITSSNRVSGTECVFNEFIAANGQNMPISTYSNNKDIYFGNNGGTYALANYYAKFIPVDTGVTGGFGFYPYNSKQANNDSITAVGGIPATKLASDMRFNQAAAIDISANPQIADGFDGQIIEITGLSDVNTLTLEDGNGLQLEGGSACVLGSGDVISLKYILSLDLWVERHRSNN